MPSLPQAGQAAEKSGRICWESIDVPVVVLKGSSRLD
jgi:hypothetical protein